MRIVRLGESRTRGEGLRLGTVRRPPRGVAKLEIAARDWYDVWFPTLAPSAETVKLAHAATSAADWAAFRKRYRTEMGRPDPRHAIGLLAALSHTTNFSVGCYCAQESKCHRSVLRDLLVERGARLAAPGRPCP